MVSKDFYTSHYTQMDERAWTWRELGGRTKAHNIATLAANLAPQKILDVGCGTGAILASLAKLNIGQAYYALDITDTAIDIVKQRSDIPYLLEAKTFDGLQIPYPQQTFDLAILSHVVEHVLNPAPLILEAARVSRYVVIEVPLEDNLYTHLKVKVFNSDYRERIGHVQWFNQNNFRSLVEKICGLEVVDFRLAYVPDEIYLFRKQGVARKLNFLQLRVRKMLRSLSGDLYARLITDHCIALVRSTL